MATSGMGSPLKGASTASSGNGSKGPCPFCGAPLIRIRSKQEATKDQWFIKCPYNVKGDSTTCPFIKSEVEYEGLQGRERRLQLKGECIDDLKEEVNVLRQIVECIGSDVCKIKGQLVEQKLQIEPKNEVEKKKGKVEIVLDSSAIAPLFLVLLGVLIGVIGVVMWNGKQ